MNQILHISKTFQWIAPRTTDDGVIHPKMLIWSKGSTFRNADDSYRKLRLRGKSALRRAKAARMSELYEEFRLDAHLPCGIAQREMRKMRDAINGIQSTN